MKSSKDTGSLSDIELAQQILNQLSHNPLLIDIKNEINKHRQLGLNDDKIETILINSFTVTKAGYSSTTMDDKEIAVINMPQQYNQLDWR